MKTHDLGEVVQNSFAVGDKGDVYIVSETALYRFQADASGAPVVRWRKVYENTGEQKPGQVSAGSGTTPTLHGDDWVSITDNADPMNVVVYRRGGGREICRQPVFETGRGLDRQLADRRRPLDRRREQLRLHRPDRHDELGARTQPGIERVDIDADGVGCRKVWHSDEISPSLVPKLSLRERPRLRLHAGPRGRHRRPVVPDRARLPHRQDGLEAPDRAGASASTTTTRPVSIGPDGTAYVGVLGGLLLVRDKTAPQQTARRGRSSSCARSGAASASCSAPRAPSGGVVAPVRGARVRAGRQTATHGPQGPRFDQGRAGPRRRDEGRLPPRHARRCRAEHLRQARRPAARGRGLRARGAGVRGLAGVHARLDDDPDQGRRRGGHRRGRHLRHARPHRDAGRRAGPAARGQPHDRVVLRARRRARPVLAGRARARRLAALPPLGVRERGARPRAAPAGHPADRGARPRGAAGHVRRVAAAGRAADDRARSRTGSRATRRCASSSTRRARGPTS